MSFLWLLAHAGFSCHHTVYMQVSFPDITLSTLWYTRCDAMLETYHVNLLNSNPWAVIAAISVLASCSDFMMSNTTLIYSIRLYEWRDKSSIYCNTVPHFAKCFIKLFLYKDNKKFRSDTSQIKMRPSKYLNDIFLCIKSFNFF